MKVGENPLYTMLVRHLKFLIVKLQCTEENDWVRNENTVRYSGKKFTILGTTFFYFSLD